MNPVTQKSAPEIIGRNYDDDDDDAGDNFSSGGDSIGDGISGELQVTNAAKMALATTPPPKSIVVSKHANGEKLPPVDFSHRAVHKIRLEALSHNYSEVESAANRQRCSVFVVVKADGYGHGAIATAIYLADSMGADAFAVATLEEGIALRRAFQQTAQSNQYSPSSVTAASIVTAPAKILPVPASIGTVSSQAQLSTLFNAHSEEASTFANNHHSVALPLQQNAFKRRSLRPTQIRIMVLGPPVGFPRCFDDYYHHNIEVMISGPEVAKSLLEWVVNADERRRTQVERQANELKEMALNDDRPRPQRVAPVVIEHRDSVVSNKSSAENSMDSATNADVNPRCHPQSATLGNVTGSDLAKEVREILRSQKFAEAQQQQQRRHVPKQPSNGGTATPQTANSTITSVPSEIDLTNPTTALPPVPPTTGTPAVAPKLFGGIEEAAKMSRTRQKAITSEVFMDNGDDDEPLGGDVPLKNSGVISTNGNRNKVPPNLMAPRKKLRWHALVDSGMGRAGFRTDAVSKEEQGKRRDSVEIIKELVDMEKSIECPIEFFGMITHMADANATSDYTNAQVARFRNLLKRVRAAGISVPTISTDNSAALLTTTLTHFDPKELLTQEHVDTRGFVRTGGAIYGQRPSFPQLRAVSTLMASVRHLAILKKGESVGYDRAYIAPMNVRIATLTIGFADGYPRELGNGVGKVCIRGHLFPVAGNVCMDMLMVELGPAGDKDCPGADIVVGDSAILWGPGDDEEGEGLVKLKDIAAILKTTQSALTCGIDKLRVRREYG